MRNKVHPALLREHGYPYEPTPDIPARDGKSLFRRSTHDGTWWRIFNNDRPSILIGRNPPRKP